MPVTISLPSPVRRPHPLIDAVPRRLRIVIADDHPVYRDGIVRALLETRRYAIAGAAGDGKSAVQLIAEERPDIALLDLRMPELDGLGALRRLRRDGIAVPVVFLTAFPHRELVEQAYAAGAAGCLSKDTPREQIVAALDTVASGGGLAREEPEGDGRPVLMDVELQLLGLLRAGWSLHELPAVAQLSRASVDRYLADATWKLAADDLRDAVVSAAAWGLIP